MSRGFRRLSSGRRIERPGDDPAGLSVASSIKFEAAIYDRAGRNLKDGISLLSIADGATTELVNVHTRLRELASQSSNGTISAGQRAALDNEFQALTAEYNRILSVTTFNGNRLFAGRRVALQAGYGTIEISTGAATQIVGGDGTFTSGATFASVNSPISVVPGDFNRDGYADFASANYASGGVRIYIGRGDGTFRGGNAVSLYAPSSLAGGDFNNDGRADLVGVSSLGGYFSILIGNGDGTFEASQVSGSTSGPAYDIATGDFNGDGNLDVVTGDHFSPSAGVFLGRGDGTFEGRRAGMLGGFLNAISAGDFDSDGFDDLVGGDGSGGGRAYVALSNGDGTFRAPAVIPIAGRVVAVEAGDFNNDTHLDYATLNDNHTAALVLGRGDGTFGASSTIPVGLTGSAAGGYYTSGIVASDLNVDGNLDLVVAEPTSGTVGVLLGNGDGTFENGTSYSAAIQPVGIATADFDRDGALDILTTNYGSASVSLLNGRPTFVTTAPGVQAIDGLNVATLAAARDADARLKGYGDGLFAAASAIGASLSRLESAVDGFQRGKDALLEAASRIEDADIAEEFASLGGNLSRQKAAAYALASIGRSRSLILDLIA